MGQDLLWDIDDPFERVNHGQVPVEFHLGLVAMVFREGTVIGILPGRFGLNRLIQEGLNPLEIAVPLRMAGQLRGIHLGLFDQALGEGTGFVLHGPGRLVLFPLLFCGH